MNAAGPVSPAEAAQQKRQFHFDLLGAASSRLEYTGLQVVATRANESGFLVQVAANQLTWTPRGEHRTSDVSLLAVAFDANDNILAQRASDFQEQIGESDRTYGAHITLTVPMSVPHNTRRIRFVVRDAGTGDIGSFELIP